MLRATPPGVVEVWPGLLVRAIAAAALRALMSRFAPPTTTTGGRSLRM